MIKLRKNILVIFLFLFTVLLTSCEIIKDSPVEDTKYTFTYSSIGNGTIVCEYESGIELNKNSYVCVLSSANEGEEFINWTINGEDNGNEDCFIILVDKDINVVANFTKNKEQESTPYDTNTIYANLPSNWTNVKLVYETYANPTPKTCNMENVNGVWEFDLQENGLKKTSISSIYFISDSKKTESYNIDSDYTYFNYSGYNYNNELCGGFDIKKVNNLMKLSVLEMNDLHGYIVQSDEGLDGISNASYIIEKIRNEDNLDNTVLIGNGDMFQGSALSNLSYGVSVVNVMNEMKFDCMGVGNHEFDWGFDKIIALFDGNKANGEANFPLVNSNISAKGTKNLITNKNIVSSYLFEKNGIKIGVISLIDNLKDSILYSRTIDYDFLGTELAKSQAIDLKNQGADIIIANIHGGESDDASSFNMNQTLSKLEYNGEWLIDCIINGHTHSNQVGTIRRAGQDLQIVQGGSYSYYVGQIDLYIDMDTKKLTTSKAFTTNTYLAKTNYTKSVQDVVDKEYDKVKDKLEEVYCKSTVTVKSKSELYTWSANVMLAASDTICGISNTGGIRSTGNIKSGQGIGLENIYLINPFDNEIMIVEMTGKQLYKFLKNGSVYYSLKSGYSLSSLQNDTKKYKVSVIDYVYYWDEFPKSSNDVNSKLIFRECMIEDLRLRTTFNPNTDTTPMIGKLIK